MTHARTLILTLALALAASAALAAASDYMPSAMIGDWGIVRESKTHHVYHRGKCWGGWPHVVNDRLSVDRSGFYVHESVCHLVAAAGAHLAFRCGKGDDDDAPWSLIDRWRLSRGRLVIDKP